MDKNNEVEKMLNDSMFGNTHYAELVNVKKDDYDGSMYIDYKVYMEDMCKYFKAPFIDLMYRGEGDDILTIRFYNKSTEGNDMIWLARMVRFKDGEKTALTLISFEKQTRYHYVIHSDEELNSIRAWEDLIWWHDEERFR